MGGEGSATVAIDRTSGELVVVKTYFESDTTAAREEILEEIELV